jgi:tRNA(Arg) A34 adenosine deaminase TadA
MAKARRKFDIKATIYDKRGRVLSSGENSYLKSHPLQGKLAKQVGRPEAIYLHAEIAALIKLKDWSKAHRIKVERYDVNGNPVIAKPCAICQSALRRTGIEIIEHT